MFRSLLDHADGRRRGARRDRAVGGGQRCGGGGVGGASRVGAGDGHGAVFAAVLILHATPREYHGIDDRDGEKTPAKAVDDHLPDDGRRLRSVALLDRRVVRAAVAQFRDVVRLVLDRTGLYGVRVFVGEGNVAESTIGCCFAVRCWRCVSGGRVGGGNNRRGCG